LFTNAVLVYRLALLVLASPRSANIRFTLS